MGSVRVVGDFTTLTEGRDFARHKYCISLFFANRVKCGHY